MEEEATLLFSQQQFTNLHATGVSHTARAGVGETKPRYSARRDGEARRVSDAILEEITSRKETQARARPR